MKKLKFAFISLFILGTIFLSTVSRAEEFGNVTVLGDFITKQSPYIDARAYGLSTSASAADNTTALQAAFDAGEAAGYVEVRIPAGAYQINGTIDNQGCPFHGAGDEITTFYVNNAAPLFDITTRGHTEIGDFSISFSPLTKTGVDSNCIGLRIKKADEGRIHNITFWRGYNAIKVQSGVGDGYIWQVSFDHIFSSYNKDYAFVIDSVSDSTTIKFNNCHVYGMAGYDPFWDASQTFKGWYIVNTTSAIFSNCSMDGGDGDIDGSVIYYTSGQNVFIDSFHLESFTHTTGGANHSPMVLRGKSNIVNNLVMISWTIDVGAGVNGTLIRTGFGTGGYFELGQVSEVATTVTTGNKIYADVTLSTDGALIKSKLLDKANFLYTTGTGKHIFLKDIYGNTEFFKQIGHTAYVTVATDATTILNVPQRGNGNDSGLFWVHGENVSTGVGFMDLIALVAARNGFTLVKLVSSQESGSPPERTYSWDNTGKNIQVLLASGSSWVMAGGFALTSP